MTSASIDSVVRDALATMQLPIHYYMQCMVYAMQATRDIGIHHYATVKAVELEVDSNNMVDIPKDFTDIVRVARKYNRLIIPMGKTNKYNRLPRFDGTDEIAYDGEDGSTESSAINYASSNTTAYLGYYGDSYGGDYGRGDGDRTDNYQLVPERRKLLIGSAVQPGQTIYLEYISLQDFATADATVHPFAAEAIREYIVFQFTLNSKTKVGEQQIAQMRYNNALRKLRASFNKITPEDIIRLTRDNIKLSVKG